MTNIRSVSFFVILGIFALACLAILLFTPFINAEDSVFHEPMQSVMARSWDVDVPHACLVDEETVKAGSITSTNDQNFKTRSRTDITGAAASDQGKAACAAAKDAARKALPGQLWAEGDRLCKQWEKAPDPGKKEDREKKKAEQCRAFRGDLKGPDIICSCDFKGQNSIQGLSDEWKVTATCKAPDVHYVCDP